ncbi:MAG: C40 family peptidase [Micropruina glycogenica]
MRVRRLALSAALVATSGLLLSVVPGAESSGAARTSTPAVAAAPTVTETLAAAHQKSLLDTSLAVARVNATLNRTPRFEYAKSKTVSLTDQRAKKVVAAALSRVSTGQYVWGASGGNSFDCSGLMMYAYRQIGISLPHSSSAQSRLGKAVSIKNLKPGDLLFFYSPVHHVGMYIGDGKFVHARNTRDDLEVDTISGYGHFTSARRIIGA